MRVRVDYNDIRLRALRWRAPDVRRGERVLTYDGEGCEMEATVTSIKNGLVFMEGDPGTWRAPPEP